MPVKYSIAEARDKFTSIIRDAEVQYGEIAITRRGEPVAVILSYAQFQKLQAQAKSTDFLTAYRQFREEWANTDDEMDNDLDWAEIEYSEEQEKRRDNPWL